MVARTLRTGPTVVVDVLLCSALVCSALALGIATGFGDPLVAHAQSDADYRAAMTTGAAEMEAGRVPEARALFLRAYGIHADSRALMLLGQAEFELREYADAVRHLRGALADTSHPLGADRRPVVTDILGQARNYIGEYRLTIEPVDATLTVDDEQVSSAEPLLVPIGTHVLVLRASGYDDLRRAIRTAGGEDQALTLTLARTTQPTATSTSDTNVEIAPPQVDIRTPAVTTAPAARPPPPQSSSTGLRDAGIGLLIAGGLLTALAIGAGVWLGQAQSDLDACHSAVTHVPPMLCNGSLMPSAEAPYQSTRDAALGVTIGMAAGAALGLGLGIAFVIVGGESHDAPADRASIRCAPGVLGLSCIGSF